MNKREVSTTDDIDRLHNIRFYIFKSQSQPSHMPLYYHITAWPTLNTKVPTRLKSWRSLWPSDKRCSFLCVSLNTWLCSLFTQLMNVVGLNLTVFGQFHCLIETQLHNAITWPVTVLVFTPLVIRLISSCVRDSTIYAFTDKPLFAPAMHLQ